MAGRSAPSSRRITAGASWLRIDGVPRRARRSATSEVSDARGTGPTSQVAAAGIGLDHRRRRDRCAAPPPPVRATRPASRSGPRPGGRHGRPHERRPVHRLRHRQPCCRRQVDDEHPRASWHYDVRAVGDAAIDRLFDATIESTEEAIVNALVAATTVVGRDGITAHALPHDRLMEVMANTADRRGG
ncbi:MAG: P1 family peptidase [Candidatus Limnocylindrales bacterium]